MAGKREKYTLRDIYLRYKADGGKLKKSLYKNICQDFNIHIMEDIIYNAETFDMGYNLSTLQVLRIKRNYKNPQIDWGATNKYKKELLSGEADEAPEEGYDLEDLCSKDNPDGVKYFIYHDSEWYCRFYWKKKYARIKNKTAYSFKATRGKKGNKTKLKEHLKEDDINYIKYKNGSQNN